VLRSKDPDGIRREVWAHLLVHYAIRTLMHQAALQAEVDPDRLSFTRTLHIARRQVTSQAAFPPRRPARATRQGDHRGAAAPAPLRVPGNRSWVLT
jgi:hypothetical protein